MQANASVQPSDEKWMLTEKTSKLCVKLPTRAILPANVDAVVAFSAAALLSDYKKVWRHKFIKLNENAPCRSLYVSPISAALKAARRSHLA